jgi:translation initiation factor 2 beta subunit (eIF-2beta)/eIF-5
MADKKKDKEEKLVAVRAFIPSELRNSFKSICVKQGVTMDSVISEFVEEYVQEYEKEREKK